MEITWQKRPYRPGDEREIQDLFRFVFGKEMGKTESERHWEWEFKENPSGPGEILLAVDQDRIVGHYAVIPQRFKVKGRRVMGTLSLDTMVHPDYQGQRIFTRLALALYDDIGGKGMPLTYGFPNKNSIHGIVNKLRWEEIAVLPVLQKTIDSKRVISRVTGSRLAGRAGSLLMGSKRIKDRPPPEGEGWRIEEIASFGREFDEIFKRGAAGMDVVLVRDSQYLDWRFIRKPENDYECFAIYGPKGLYGYIAFKIEEKFDFNSAFVMDYFSAGDEPALDGRLIAWGTDYLSYRGVDIIVVAMFPHTPYYRLFRKRGYFRIPRRLFPKDIYFCARKNSGEIDFDLIRNKRSWYLTWGDTDVV
jgi:GNAT superfamily N-acetyltransferase